LSEFGEEGVDGADAGGDDELLVELAAASVQGRAALGERAGEWDQRVSRGTQNEPFVKGPLCAEVDGFSLHAAVRVEARDRDRLEHLCRYAGRAAIAENRLSELPDGRVAYSLKKRWKDGTTHVVMTKQVLMERLCALVPRPRRHLVTYHGVFAPAAGIRRWVVPKVEAEGALPASASGASAGLVAAAVRAVVGGGAAQPAGVSLQAELAESVRRSLSARASGARRKRRTGPRRRYPWAELLRRVFLVEVLVCPRCGNYLSPFPPRLSDELRVAAVHEMSGSHLTESWGGVHNVNEEARNCLALDFKPRSSGAGMPVRYEWFGFQLQQLSVRSR
jgi:hypothetical protein